MALIAAIFTFDLAPDHSVELEATLTLRPRPRHLIARSRS
jgi:hypothetical protein